jgi:quercetin dioxygenase-like cupin family protein
MGADQATLQQKLKLAISHGSSSQYVEGRRAFFKYRDLGVTEASGGRMRAQVTSADQGLSQPTGWHYHNCEIQFVYMLEGWADLEFEGGRTVRLEAGDSVMIPGGERHQEVRTSESFKLLEISLPSDMGTVPCDPPR